jgi:hypothetical protein
MANFHWLYCAELSRDWGSLTLEGRKSSGKVFENKSVGENNGETDVLIPSFRSKFIHRCHVVLCEGSL